MPQKLFQKTFENFDGLDYKSTDLTRAKTFAKDLQNYGFSKGYSLKGRHGCQLAAPPGDFLGVHTYSYYDTNSGATKQEVIAVNDNLFRLRSESLSVFRSGTPNYNFRFTLSSVTGTSKFYLTDNNAVVIVKDLGTGWEDLPVTVYDLATAINGATGFTCSYPTKSAIVNGAQNNVSTITVNAGHGFVVGDVITLWDYLLGKLTRRRLLAVTATTLAFNATFQKVSVKNLQIIGRGAAPAATIAWNDQYTSSLATQTISYNYWDAAYWLDNNINYQSVFPGMWALRDDPSFTPPSFVNGDNVCYIGYPDNTTSPTAAPVDLLSTPYGRICVYDGQTVKMAGMLSGTINSVTNAGGGSVPQGTYKYFVRWKFTDNTGNVIYGNPHPAPETGASITLAGSSTVAVNFSTVNSNFPWLNPRCGYESTGGNQGPTNTFSLSDQSTGSHTFDIGDKVYFYDNVASAFTVRTVTAVQKATAPFTMTFDGAQATLPANSSVSNNFNCEIWRTKTGGLNYYLVAEIPNIPFQTSITYNDNKTDLLLGKAYAPLAVPIGREHDLPPRARFLCLHQGLLVAAGDNNNPNTVAVADVDGNQYFPLASNYFDIPSNITSAISAIASDTADRLAVFKDNGYYDVQGDCAQSPPSVSITVVTEGDYGVASHASLKKVKGVLIGVGKLGPVGIKDGSLLSEIGKRIAPSIWRNKNLKLSQAQGFNDYNSMRYILHIPAIEGFTPNASTANTLTFSLDYSTVGVFLDKVTGQELSPPGGQAYGDFSSYSSRGYSGAWFNWKYSTGTEPSSGMLMYLDTPHHLSRSWGGSGPARRGLLYRETNLLGSGSNYSDNHLPITYNIRLAAEHLGEPSLDKQYQFFKVFSMVGFYDLQDWTQFNLSIQSYRDFQSSVPDTAASFFFSSVSEFEHFIKLRAGKARALEIFMQTSAIGECPYITGYELVVDPSYIEEDFKKT